MNDFVEKLRLKGRAEEDIYFARKDLELIEALHAKKLAKASQCGDKGCKAKADAFERRFEAIKDKHGKRPRKLALSLRALLKEIRATCKRLP